MIKLSSSQLLIGLAFLLGGCASASGPLFDSDTKPQPQKALILFFRPDLFYAGGASPDVYVDNAKVGSIDNGGYIVINLEPGGHVVTVPHNFWNWDEECSPVELQVTASKTYYVELALDVKKSTSLVVFQTYESRCQLKELDEQDALPLIKLTRQSK
ncbi:MAG: DUF2846 domain-containing protein [Gammaproteobacteria bacterium]